MTLWMVGEVTPTLYRHELDFPEWLVPYGFVFSDPLEYFNVAFNDMSGLVKGDTWTVLMSVCGVTNPMPKGATATLTSQDGTSAVTQLTFDRGFEGAIAGAHEIYSVNQHFTVRATGTEVQSITVSNTESSTNWVNGEPSYRLGFNGSAVTGCLAYNVEDWELEVCLAPYNTSVLV